MSQTFEIEAQGDHHYVVHLHGDGQDKESWFQLSAGALGLLGAGEADEERVVRQTVEFLGRYQDAVDFPDVVELEDVIAGYDDFVRVMTHRPPRSSRPTPPAAPGLGVTVPRTPAAS